MFKVFLLFAVLLNTVVCNSQHFYAEIIYKEVARYSRNGVFETKLSFTKNESLYTIQSFQNQLNDSKDDKVTNKVNLKSNNDLNDYFYRKNGNNSIMVHDNFLDHSIFYRDDPLQEWEMLEGSKTIMGLICHKAQTTFRGRVYTAWYTHKLPVKYGPRNLYGLPGVILELEENTGLIKVIATSISSKILNKNINLKPDHLDSVKLLSRLEYKNLKKSVRLEKSKRIQSKLPPGQHIDWGCEDCIIELELE